MKIAGGRADIKNALAVAEIDISKTVMKQNGIRAANNRQQINYLEENEMKELAMDIIKMNKRGVLAKAELEKMMGCKLEDMTDNQKTLGLAMLVSFESQWNK